MVDHNGGDSAPIGWVLNCSEELSKPTYQRMRIGRITGFNSGNHLKCHHFYLAPLKFACHKRHIRRQSDKVLEQLWPHVYTYIV